MVDRLAACACIRQPAQSITKHALQLMSALKRLLARLMNPARCPISLIYSNFVQREKIAKGKLSCQTLPCAAVNVLSDNCMPAYLQTPFLFAECLALDWHVPWNNDTPAKLGAQHLLAVQDIQFEWLNR